MAVTRRQAMNAYGKYLDYAEHLGKIKRGEAEGSRAEFARACVMLHHEAERKAAAFMERREVDEEPGGE